MIECFHCYEIFLVRRELQVDTETECERAAESHVARIDTLVENAIGSRELRIATQIVGKCEEIVGLSPDAETLQPREVYRHLICKVQIWPPM